MGDKTKIEWTDATWNPTTGCTKVSPGCDHCYIVATPPFRMEGRTFLPVRAVGESKVGQTTGVRLHPDRLDQPLRWTRPRRVFVNSLSDLFHKDVPDEFIAHVWAVMTAAERHTFQVLTKRPARARSLLRSVDFWRMVSYRLEDMGIDADVSHSDPPGNVWVGTSVEDQERADLRIPVLLDTPAAVRFLSCEPLLGPVTLPRFCACGCNKPLAQARSEARAGSGWLNPDQAEAGVEATLGVDWVIVGGESGKDARPMHPDWARSLRNQCVNAGVAFHYKQHGEHIEVDPSAARPGDVWVLPETGATQPWRPDTAGAPAGRWGPHADVVMRRVGKRNAGRELDGRTWDEMP